MTTPPPTTALPERLPLLARVLLVDPSAVDAALLRLRRAGTLPAVPNAWQVTLGIARMWHRVLFRSDTIGTSSTHPVRATRRARLFRFRPLRFPFLLAERAVAPLDFSGLLSSRERVLRHLLGAHHDGSQFAYDLEMLALDPGALDELRARVSEQLAGDTPRTRFLRDLVVYEGYHEALAEAVERALDGDFGLSDEDRVDPDISFAAYLRWCARQPATPRETWVELVAGRYTIAEGLC